MSIFGGGPSAPPPVQVPTLSDPAIIAARQSEVAAATRARGRAATILTGGAGVPGAAPTQPKMLLGN